ncbi:MAG: hypothetical protein LBP33_01465 [Candidatus Adiutrix sp.]|jgi:hypothetical protein|nr:hypothetical protein [Candidatus Adiutrix sp.]
MRKPFSAIISLLAALLLSGQALSAPGLARTRQAWGPESAENSARAIMAGSGRAERTTPARAVWLGPQSRPALVKDAAFGGGGREREFRVKQEQRPVAVLRSWNLKLTQGDQTFVLNSLKPVCFFTFMARLKMAMIRPETRPANSLVRSRDGPALKASVADQIRLSSGAAWLS